MEWGSWSEILTPFMNKDNAEQKKFKLSLGILGRVQSWLQQLDEGLWLGALWVLGNGKGKASFRHP